MIKRNFDCVAASLGLVALSPVLCIVAVVVRLSSPGPILFRQMRVGLNNGDFELFKFRTMTVTPGSETGTFDIGDGSRVTSPGRVLRAWKLDELPQLWNVLRGDMSLVGPRPEVRKWVQADPGRWSVVHSIRPGITDPAAIVFRHEERILAKVPDPEAVYRECILPRKLELYCEYVSTRTFRGDLWIMIRTMIAVARSRGATSIEA
jgi:lipopolysaccharide/colanic/teichoic acid biosynthesis glycosyltransferase